MERRHGYCWERTVNSVVKGLTVTCCEGTYCILERTWRGLNIIVRRLTVTCREGTYCNLEGIWKGTGRNLEGTVNIVVKGLTVTWKRCIGEGTCEYC